MLHLWLMFITNFMCYNDMKVSITLWGKLAKKYTDEHIKSFKEMKIVLIVTSCKVVLFRGVFYLL